MSAILTDVNASLGDAQVAALKRFGQYSQVAGYLAEGILLGRDDLTVVEALHYTSSDRITEGDLFITVGDPLCMSVADVYRVTDLVQDHLNKTTAVIAA
jgi:hypothetical protein